MYYHLQDRPRARLPKVSRETLDEIIALRLMQRDHGPAVAADALVLIFTVVDVLETQMEADLASEKQP